MYYYYFIIDSSMQYNYMRLTYIIDIIVMIRGVILYIIVMIRGVIRE